MGPISQSLYNGYNSILAFSLPIYEQIFFPKIRLSVSDILPVVPDTKNGCSTMLSSDQGPLECVLWKGGEPSSLPRCVVWADHGPPLNHWIPPSLPQPPTTRFFSFHLTIPWSDLSILVVNMYQGSHPHPTTTPKVLIRPELSWPISPTRHTLHIYSSIYCAKRRHCLRSVGTDAYQE